VDLVNRTGAAAFLYPVNLLEPELRAAVVVKKTYALGSDGRLSQASDPMPLVADQLVTDYGVFHGELFFRKRGADVCLLGTARFQRAVTVARVRLEIGTWGCELDLVGDRVWSQSRRGGDPIPSAPAPFTEMPISYARAFGGVAEVNGEDVPWPDNPTGRGYYESADEAVGKPLPNIQPAGSPEPRWSDRPRVAGWGPYPMYWGLRSAAAVKYDQRTGQLLEVTPELFNHAHPDLILPELEAGAPVRISGMGGPPIQLAIPRERPRVSVQIGAARLAVLGELDGLFIWTDAARVVVTWRARFRYAVRPEEIRRAELTFVED